MPLAGARARKCECRLRIGHARPLDCPRPDPVEPAAERDDTSDDRHRGDPAALAHSMALYLLSFTIVFSQQKLLPHAFFVRWLPLAAIVLLITLLSRRMIQCARHGAAPGGILLAGDDLPRRAVAHPAATQHLTDFYLCLAVGGVLGGALNALVAPLLFPASGNIRS